MIETLFASVNGYTTIPGRKNFYKAVDNGHQVKLSKFDNLELTYENGFYEPNVTPSNVQLADPASVISATDYGTWTYNILMPRKFILSFLEAQGMAAPNLNGGKDSLVVQGALDSLYEVYKNQMDNSDKLTDFVPWIVDQINGFSARNNISLYISEFTYPSMRKIQYIDQANSIAADTNQGTQFGISHTKYKVRKDINFSDRSERFYRLAIEVITNPTVFAADKYRTNLTIQDFDIRAMRIDDFYVVHPKINSNGKTFIDTNMTVRLFSNTNSVAKTAHGLSNGTPIKFSTIETITGVNLRQTYYVINRTANSFQISNTLSGSPISFSGGEGRCIITYETAVPLMISAYPELTIKIGVSDYYTKPTLSNFVRREDLNLLDRSIALKESVQGFSAVNNLDMYKTGNLFLKGGLPLTSSGYAFTGDIIGFMGTAINTRGIDSGLYDVSPTTPSSLVQLGKAKVYAKLVQGARTPRIDRVTYSFYNVDAVSGKFKAVNETGFFKTQSVNPVLKSGVYRKIMYNTMNYINNNYSEFIETAKRSVTNNPEYTSYKEAENSMRGAYGVPNLYYLRSGTSFGDTMLQLDFYMFANCPSFNTATNDAQVNAIRFIDTKTWKSNVNQILSLGNTGNLKWTLDSTNNRYTYV
jgi:hypothetical protein